MIWIGPRRRAFLAALISIGAVSATTVIDRQPAVAKPALHVTSGYWLVTADGQVLSVGNTGYEDRDSRQKAFVQGVVGMVPTPTGHGYWLTASDGGVFSFGDAVFHGSTGDRQLNQPVVGIASDVYGGGYWLVARDGGV